MQQLRAEVFQAVCNSASSRWHSRTSFKASRRFALASSMVSPCEIAAGISSTKQVYPPSLAGSKTAVSFMLVNYQVTVAFEQAIVCVYRQRRASIAAWDDVPGMK